MLVTHGENKCEKDSISHLPSNLCFRKSKRAFCIMSVTFAEVKKIEQGGLTGRKRSQKVRKEVSRRILPTINTFYR